MPNPSGTSNLNFPVPYGDVKKRTELLRSAPISGAPISGRALETPRRAKRQAVRAAPAAAQQQPAAPAAEPQMPYRVWLAQQWATAAAQPGANDRIKALAEQSAKEAGFGA